MNASPLKLLPFFWKSAVKPSCLFDFEGRDDSKHRGAEGGVRGDWYLVSDFETVVKLFASEAHE